MSSPKGSLVLVPLPVAEGMLHTLPAEIYTHTAGLRHYFVENARTARRFLRLLHKDLVLEQVEMSEIDKHAGPDTTLLRKWLKGGHKIGVMSEAGCPAIADPGSILVAVAHDMGAKVQPLTGPSSIILALMASGLNGQSFAFHGYLPVKEPARSKRIKELEAISARDKQTQIFIETPYRNNPLLADLLKVCSPGTLICIAQDISGATEQITTRTAQTWKQNLPELEKVPAVFLVLA